MPPDFFALSDKIKAEYSASGCDPKDAAHALKRLMTECRSLFEHEDDAWSFLHEGED